MRLILLRHGETLWNKEHRLQGHLNSPLSEKGIAQAKAIKPLIEKFSLKKVICSDLERAKQTAELIGFPNATPDSHLRELAMGEWEGRKKDEIMQETPSFTKTGETVTTHLEVVRVGKIFVIEFQPHFFSGQINLMETS